MQGAAKLDYLKKYVTTKKTKTDKKAKNQIKVIDYEMDDPELRHSGGKLKKHNLFKAYIALRGR